MAAPRVLVLGIGNILLSDEGVGVHVINRFQETFSIPDGVEVIDGGTMGTSFSCPILREGPMSLSSTPCAQTVRSREPSGVFPEVKSCTCLANVFRRIKLDYLIFLRVLRLNPNFPNILCFWVLSRSLLTPVWS